MNRGSLNTYEVTLPPGEWVDAPGHGSEIAFLSLPGQADVEFIRPDGGSLGVANEMQVGYSGGPGEYFASIRLRSATGQTVKYAVTSGQFRVSTVAGSVEVQPPGALAGIPDVTIAAGATATLLASDSNRDHAVIVADGANAADVRVGGIGSVGAAQGLKLAPEQSLTIYGGGGVAVHNPNGSPCVFQVLSVSRS